MTAIDTRPAVRDAMVTVVKALDAEASVGDVRALLADDHVHLVVVLDDSAEEPRVVTTITRSDRLADVPIGRLGTLEGRTVGPDDDLEAVHQRMLAVGLRRLLVVEDGRLLGLLCLKRHGGGFCSDTDVLARASGLSPWGCTD